MASSYSALFCTCRRSILFVRAAVLDNLFVVKQGRVVKVSTLNDAPLGIVIAVT